MKVIVYDEYNSTSRTYRNIIRLVNRSEYLEMYSDKGTYRINYYEFTKFSVEIESR